jgi:hypothetical protein
MLLGGDPMINAMEISEELLSSTDTSVLERLFRKAEETPETARKLQGSIVLTFDVNAPVVCLEPRVKAFLLAAHERIPHLWYFLAPDKAYNNLTMFFAVIGSQGTVTVQGDKIRCNPGQSELLALADRLAATKLFADRMGDQGVRVLYAILEPLGPEMRASLMQVATKLAQDP